MAAIDTGALLGAFTGRLLVQGGFHEIHKAIEILAGHPVWTHQLGRVMDELKARYLPCNPELADTVATIERMFDSDAATAIQAAQLMIEMIGQTMEVEILPPGEMVEPIEELRGMVDKSTVIIGVQ